MTIRQNLAIISIMVIISGLSGCGAKNSLTLKQLQADPESPEWLEAIETVPAESMFSEYQAARKNAANMKLALGKYAYLLEANPGHARVPFWLFQSAVFYQSLDYDHLAFHFAGRLVGLPASAPCTAEWSQFPDLPAYQKAATLVQLRVLAGNGLEDDFTSLASGFEPSRSSHFSQLGQAYMLLGDNQKALQMFDQALQEEHLERSQSKSSYAALATAMAYAIGDFNKVEKYSGWMIDLGRSPAAYIPADDRGYYANQWQSCYEIVTKFRDLAASGRKINNENLADGTYTTSCRGFIDLIDVTLTVADGSVQEIDVTNRADDRPFSAAEILPQRILSRESVVVDAITSATITSSAILAAASEAFSQASD